MTEALWLVPLKPFKHEKDVHPQFLRLSRGKDWNSHSGEILLKECPHTCTHTHTSFFIFLFLKSYILKVDERRGFMSMYGKTNTVL